MGRGDGRDEEEGLGRGMHQVRFVWRRATQFLE
jgi:hypothetical protein